jgi:hypothetical protein
MAITHMDLLLSRPRSRARCVICGEKRVAGYVMSRRQKNGSPNFECERCGAPLHSVCYWNAVAGAASTQAFWTDDDAQHVVICASCRS